MTRLLRLCISFLRVYAKYYADENPLDVLCEVM